jgi:rRNA maturation endonuclease Nob1
MATRGPAGSDPGPVVTVAAEASVQVRRPPTSPVADTPSLALRHVVCDACGTAFALPDDPAEPDACGRCGARPLRELSDARGADAYFAP